MKINHDLVLRNEQPEKSLAIKFVVIRLSNGSVYVRSRPYDGDVAHADIVVDFCKEQGFISSRPLEPIREVAKAGVRRLTVDGGGEIRYWPGKYVATGYASGAYGAAPRSIIEPCVREALQQTSWSDCSRVTFEDLRDD